MAEFTEANRQHFDQQATTYKQEFAPLLKLLSKELQDRHLWISDKWTDTEAGKGQEIKMLDYACGGGSLSVALAPFLTKIVGLDISDSMVNEFNKTARDAGLSDRLAAYNGNLLAEATPDEFLGPEFFDFDLVLVSLALHHFADPDLALKRLGSRLKKGGVCLIIDFIPHNHDDHHKAKDAHADAVKTVKTHGFSSDDMRKLYEDAGLGANIDYKVVEEPFVYTKNGVTLQKTIFIARAQRI